MKKIHFRRLVRGAVVIVVLQVLRLILVQVLPDTAANAASFLTVFLSILTVYIFLVAFAADNLGGKIPQKIHLMGELIIIAGIVIGVLGMFQAFALDVYRLGFHVVLVSLFSYIAWTHIPPKTVAQKAEETEAAEMGGASLASELEQSA